MSESESVADPVDLLFVDTETLGLSINDHEIWEIACALNNGPVVSHIVPHSLACYDPVALELNRYWARFPDGATQFAEEVDSELCRLFSGKTLVGANIAFDAARLERRWGLDPWHYRLVDIESAAMFLFNLPRPKGMKWISDRLREMGFAISEPDHTAAGDVVCLRECYHALRRFLVFAPDLSSTR